jgi:hypothetical protein
LTAPPNPLPRFACQTGELLRNPPAGSPAGAFKTRIKKLSRTPQHQPAKPIRHRKHNPVTLSLSTISPPLNLAEISLPSGSYLNWKILSAPCVGVCRKVHRRERGLTRRASTVSYTVRSPRTKRSISGFSRSISSASASASRMHCDQSTSPPAAGFAACSIASARRRAFSA